MHNATKVIYYCQICNKEVIAPYKDCKCPVCGCELIKLAIMTYQDDYGENYEVKIVKEE